MFGSAGARARPTWKWVEDDFQLGACSRQVFGYLCRNANGEWTAFNENAGEITKWTDLESARAALWGWHLRDSKCERTPVPQQWSPFKEALPEVPWVAALLKARRAL